MNLSELRETVAHLRTDQAREYQGCGPTAEEKDEVYAPQSWIIAAEMLVTCAGEVLPILESVERLVNDVAANRSYHIADLRLAWQQLEKKQIPYTHWTDGYEEAPI